MKTLIVLDDQNVLHFAGNGASDTTTLCGMSCPVTDSNAVIVECAGCKALALQIANNATAIKRVVKLSNDLAPSEP